MLKNARKTGTKATKTGAKPSKAPKSQPKAASLTESKEKGKKTPPAKAPAAPKHPPVPEGGQITINESVGCHFRTTTTDCPKEGETVIISFGDNKVVLVAKCITPTKDGNRLVQAFVQKGSGDYAKLAPAKGALATWKRGGALPAKPKASTK